MKFFNDQLIWDDLPLEELAGMLRSAHIQDFALGCEELSHTGTPAAFAALRDYYPEADPFRKPGLLAVLFNFPNAPDLTAEALEALTDTDPEVVTTALVAVANGKVTVPDDAILTALEENREDLDCRAFQALDRVARTPENAARIAALQQD